VSKATKTLNLSEDIFAGMDFVLRGGGGFVGLGWLTPKKYPLLGSYMGELHVTDTDILGSDDDM